MAVSGKLTKQLKSDGNAEDLFEKIQKTKEQLIKDKKIKREKALKDIDETELPFDIPKNWKWCCFRDVVCILNGDRGKNYPSKSKLSNKGMIPFISASNIDNNTISTKDLLFLTKEQFDALNAGKLVKGDLVLCIRGSLGKNGIFPYDMGAIASSLVILRCYDKKFINDKYISYYLDSPLFVSEIKKYDNGTSQPNLAADNVKKFNFSLPPSTEQNRIVEMLDKIMNEIDGISKNIKEFEIISK